MGAETSLGMRGKDVRTFCRVANKYQIYILVRKTNVASLEYIGKVGYYPKPAAIKAKTADKDSLFAYPVSGVARTVKHQVAGLVVHPWLQPDVFGPDKISKAKKYWLETMDDALSGGANIPLANLGLPSSWEAWGKERVSPRTGWRWRIDVDPASKHFGCLQISKNDIPLSYVHGDYDLKDVINIGSESENQRIEKTVDGVKNYVPILKGITFEDVQKELNDAIGTPMVQHGSEAQFAWHGDEPIVLISPHEYLLQMTLLENAEAVQKWYMDMNRKLIAKHGHDYIGDKTRWFWFGNHGNIFLPGTNHP